MPWTRLQGRHVFVARNARPAQATPSTSGNSSLEIRLIDTGGVANGLILEYSGMLPDNISSFSTQASNGFDTGVTKLQAAQPESPCAAGVVVGTNKLKTSGTVLAWVVRAKRTLDLNGLYNTSQNGISSGKTCILQRGNFFAMLASRNDEIHELTDKFQELTGV